MRVHPQCHFIALIGWYNYLCTEVIKFFITIMILLSLLCTQACLHPAPFFLVILRILHKLEYSMWPMCVFISLSIMSLRSTPIVTHNHNSLLFCFWFRYHGEVGQFGCFQLLTITVIDCRLFCTYKFYFIHDRYPGV